MRHYPGEVWFLPPELREGGDSKGRRHVLVTCCEDVNDVGIFAYASTRITEARFGAACLFVDSTSRVATTGFTRPSYVYASRLVPTHSEDLLRMTGRLIDEMPRLRRLLREALGFGSNRRESAANLRVNWRGKVVRLTEEAVESIGCVYAIVVTEPGYSSHRRYQMIVPVFASDEFASAPGDLEIVGGEWVAAITSGSGGLLIATRYVQSVFHPLEIEGWTGAVVDDDTMGRIENALIEMFEL